MNNKIIPICIYTILFLALIISFGFLSDIQPSVKASTIDVGPGQTYTTIQEGIEASNPGDTVYVHASVYYENIVINKTINLTGENKETTIIDGMGGPTEVVSIEANYVNISDLTVRNAEYGIIVTSNHSKVLTNVICNTSFGGIGIAIAGSYNVITANEFYNNTESIFISLNAYFTSVNTNVLHDNLRGVIVNGENNVVENNEINNSSQYGIIITGSNHTIFNNIINEVGISGIDMANLDTFNNTISNNIIDNAGSVGIRIWLGAHNNSVYNCIINNSKDIGIYMFRSQDCCFVNSTILNSINSDITISQSNTTFLNATFDNSKVHFEDNSSTLTIQWYLHVSVRDIGNNSIPNATIEVYNNTDFIVASGKTDNEGVLKWIMVTERIQNYSTNVTHTPHNVTVLKNSYISYAVPEPIMDISKQVNITLLILPPLHHIGIIPTGPESYYISDSQIYTTIGWNDPAETQMNLTWTPLWSIDNTSIATIDPGTGFFTATALGSSAVNVTTTTPTGIYETSIFTVEPWPLHHISISPVGPETYYIGDIQTYTVIGYNDAVETQINTTWTPEWSVDNSSIASINHSTGEFTALALGSGIVNVTDSTILGIYNTSSFIIEPWPLHHIIISPLGPRRYYIGDEETYTTIGWNDAAETQENTTWTPLWSVDNSSLATIDSITGEFMAVSLGSGAVNVTSTAPTGIYNTSSFVVEPWSLHHIVITPVGPENYYIGDTGTYTAVGWNDAQETQMNYTWTPLWNVDDPFLLSINSSTGMFEALALGSGFVNVSDPSSEIYNTSTITIHPWPLHHIVITPIGPENYYIGDTKIYSAIGYNDADETQVNDTWTPIWNIGNSTIGTIDETGHFTALALGTSTINVFCSALPEIHFTSNLTVLPWPLYHITIFGGDPLIIYIDDTFIIRARGWNDAEGTQENDTWIPVWSVEGGIGEIIGEGQDVTFKATNSGEGFIKCSGENTDIYVSFNISVKEKDQEEIPLILWILFIVVIIIICLIIFLLLYWKKIRKNEKGEK